jgi:hypothetical protein
MICDGQRVTVFFVAQQELTFVVGAPQCPTRTHELQNALATVMSLHGILR